MKRIISAIALVVMAVAPAHARAQDMGRFRVLIPDFEPLDGAEKDFGRDAAKELRDLINTLPTHQPIERKEIEQSLKKLKIKMEELDCARTRQLATQMNAQVALCASYSERSGQYLLNAEFWDADSPESFKVDPTTVGEKEEQAAAKHVFGQFDEHMQELRFARSCEDHAESGQWDNALRDCDRALALNPGAVAVRYQRARALDGMDRYPEALTELERVLDIDGRHEGALQLAGSISAKEGDGDQALSYYSKYLELNPGNVSVRTKIAYDLAQAGDPNGAMQLIQAGLDVDPDNVDLEEQYGGYAFAEGYFRKAIDAYKKVVSSMGADTPVALLTNIVAAYIQLDEVAEAIAMAEEALGTHPEADALWSIYADALQRAGKIDEANRALDRVEEINPSYPNVGLRQGQWLIQAGRIQDAVAVLKGAVDGGPEQADVAARLIFADAYGNGIQKERWRYAVDGISAARELPGLTSGMMSQLDFWHGYALYTSAVKEQEPNTLPTAKATLPKFEKAVELFRQGKEYADSEPSITLTQLLANAETYIAIQQAIIKRGS